MISYLVVTLNRVAWHNI